MLQFRKILVGVPAPLAGESDWTPDPPTQAALNQARDLGQATSAAITLFAVVDPPAGLLSSQEENERHAVRCLDAAQQALDQLAAQLKDEGVTAEARVVQGQAWHEICLAVLQDGFDLVLAGTRNVSSIQRFLFGGTGLKLLRHCPCPVWVVKPREDEQGERDILVASQLDEVGQTGIRLAVDGSSILDARVHVLNVIDLPSARQLGMNADEMDAHRESVRKERDAALREQLAQTDYRTVEHGVEVHVQAGQPYSCILDTIESRSIDLLIMGTAARGGLRGAIIGNTAEHLLHEVPCSVLAIKPPDFECPVSAE